MSHSGQVHSSLCFVLLERPGKEYLLGGLPPLLPAHLGLLSLLYVNLTSVLPARTPLRIVGLPFAHLDRACARQQAAHDIKIGTEIEHRAFLLTSMLAIQARNIKQHILTWTDSDEGDSHNLPDSEARSIQLFKTEMNASVYREPLRPVSVPRIEDWDSRPSPPLVTADRWAQMPYT